MKQTLDHLSDEELLRLMLAGGRDAFAQLYQRWQAKVYRFALRLSESETMAEDVMQDVFLTLMREGQQYAGRGSFAAYLLTITRHSTIRRLQRERRFVTLEADDDEFEESVPVAQMLASSDPLTEFARHEQVDAVRSAVLALPLHYREVVLLCHLHELSYAEAATVIGCEIGTVCSRLYRARALLAERLNALNPHQAVLRPAPPAPQEGTNLKRCLA